MRAAIIITGETAPMPRRSSKDSLISGGAVGVGAAHARPFAEAGEKIVIGNAYTTAKFVVPGLTKVAARVTLVASFEGNGDTVDVCDVLQQ